MAVVTGHDRLARDGDHVGYAVGPLEDSLDSCLCRGRRFSALAREEQPMIGDIVINWLTISITLAIVAICAWVIWWSWR